MADIEARIKQVVIELNKHEAERLKNAGYTNEAFFNKDGSLTKEYSWYYKEGRVYYYLNCGSSGAFMVRIEDGEIFNIKGYGKIDKNKKLKADIGNIFSVDTKFMHSKRWNYLR